MFLVFKAKKLSDPVKMQNNLSFLGYKKFFFQTVQGTKKGGKERQRKEKKTIHLNISKDKFGATASGNHFEFY